MGEWGENNRRIEEGVARQIEEGVVKYIEEEVWVQLHMYSSNNCCCIVGFFGRQSRSTNTTVSVRRGNLKKQQGRVQETQRGFTRSFIQYSVNTA